MSAVPAAISWSACAWPASRRNHEKVQAPGRTGGMPSHLSPRLLRAWADRVQTGACIVRQAQERIMPEYIRPGTIPSTLAVTPAAVEVHNNVRWVSLIWGSDSRPQGARPILLPVAYRVREFAAWPG